MRTVAKITEGFIAKSPYLEEALGLGIINLSALSRKLKPKIESESLKKISIGAIVMALQRLSVNLKKKHFGKTKILSPKDLTLRSNIVEYVFFLSPGFNKVLQELVGLVDGQNDIYITSAQGVNEATIFISQTVSEQVENLFKKEKLLFKLEKQSVIILRFGENTIGMPGVYYSVLKALAWEGVPINEVISVGNELSIIVEAKHIHKAFSVLQGLVQS